MDKILRFPGPVCTITNIRAAASSKTRGEWSPALVREAMERSASPGDQAFTVEEVVTLDRTVAFIKRVPNVVNQDGLKKHSSVSRDEYETCFNQNDFNLPLQKCNSLIAKSKFADEIRACLNLN